MKALLILLVTLIGSTGYAEVTPETLQTETNRLTDLAGRDQGGYMAELDKLATDSPELSEAILDQQSGSTAYEIYREYKRDKAANYEEFLNWATPQEIAADSVDGSGVSAADEANAQPPAALQVATGDADSDFHNMIQNVAGGSLSITVSIARQSMSAVGAGVSISGHRVATGRPGHTTPRGCHRVDHTERMHYSQKYKAPMPLSVVFIPQYFIALHIGNTGVKSHGCVHVNGGDESLIYSTTNAIGAHNVEVCVE